MTKTVTYINHFNETPRALRQINSKMTLGELGRLTGISRSGLSRIFNGGRDPKLTNAVKIADALGCTVDDIHAAVAESVAIESPFRRAA